MRLTSQSSSGTFTTLFAAPLEGIGVIVALVCSHCLTVSCVPFPMIGALSLVVPSTCLRVVRLPLLALPPHYPFALTPE